MLLMYSFAAGVVIVVVGVDRSEEHKVSPPVVADDIASKKGTFELHFEIIIVICMYIVAFAVVVLACIFLLLCLLFLDDVYKKTTPE